MFPMMSFLGVHSATIELLETHLVTDMLEIHKPRSATDSISHRGYEEEHGPFSVSAFLGKSQPVGHRGHYT